MVLAARGHEVIYLRDVALRQTDDPVLNAHAEALHAVVVTWNDKDFRDDNPRRPEHNQLRYRRAGRLTFRKCTEPLGIKRVAQLMEEIEFNYARALQRRDTRFMMEIRSHRYYVEV